MNKKLFGLGCLGAIVLAVIVVGGWMMNSYNSMVVSQEEAKTAWSNIDVILKRNQQELNSLEKWLRSAKKFNKEALENMVAARAKATQITIDPSNCTPEQMRQWSQAQGELMSAMSHMMVVHEAQYPELKGNEHYTKTAVALEGAVNRLEVARRNYNEKVQSYMIKTRSFPTVILAGIFGFGPMYLYEAPMGTEENTTDFSGLDD